MSIPVIFDTDIGTDVDDIIALALILTSPELELIGVTTVHADVHLRATMVLKVLALRGITNVPVMAGTSDPLLRLVPRYWEGHEGQGLLEPGDAETYKAAHEHAVDYLVRTVMDNPGKIHLLAVGPMTNVAAALIREPRLAQNLAHVTIMGGVVRGHHALDLPFVEHNIRLDPEAAHILFTSGVPLTAVPLDVTTQVRITKDDVARIRREGGTAFHEAVASQLEHYPRFARTGWTFMHDPLAIAAAIRPELVTCRSLHVHVETEGRHTRGATLAFEPTEWSRWPDNDPPGKADFALEVDTPAFEAFLVDRLSS